MTTTQHGKNDNQCGEPFESVEESWFWFVNANEARNSGVRYVAGIGKAIRPCEPADMIMILQRLYRGRKLTINHLRVLKHYGARGYAPDKYFYKEKRAWFIWKEAMNKLRPVLEKKKIIKQQHQFNFFEIRNAFKSEEEFNHEYQGAF